jgi:protein SCO1/2
VSLRTVEKPRLLTFIYTMCPTVCPVLTSTMRNVQTDALNNGYGDQVEFFPLTFDPARDDAERLRAYANEMNVALDAGNWHFLRPESEARAKEVIQEQFGVTFQKQSTTPSDDGKHNESTSEDGHNHDHGAYEFVHTGLTLLVNSDHYVEQAYQTSSPDAEQIISDLKTVRNA